MISPFPFFTAPLLCVLEVIFKIYSKDIDTIAFIKHAPWWGCRGTQYFLQGSSTYIKQPSRLAEIDRQGVFHIFFYIDPPFFFCDAFYAHVLCFTNTNELYYLFYPPSMFCWLLFYPKF